MSLVEQNPGAESQLEKSANDVGTAGGNVSLGKGAWDCDTNQAIPPDREAEVFEEIANMDMPYEGIPTVPLRKDIDHMTFFCNGCRYRVTAHPEWTVEAVKRALIEGGIARANKAENIRNTPGISDWSHLEFIYAGQRLGNDKKLKDYHVPPGCQCLIAIEKAKLELGKPEVDSAYWN